MARSILEITGPDKQDFLQGLITNDIRKLDQGMVYAAMLTPQGKYLADFFLVRAGDAVLLDVDNALAPSLMQRLNMYRLRADVAIREGDLYVHRGTGDVPADGFADPRHADMGWRAYRDIPQTDDTVDWTARRVQHVIPDTGQELGPDSFILEMGFERLNGVDFRKGCYVGQEVTARMKHKTELRKGLAQVHLEGVSGPGTQITRDGKAVGVLHSRSGDMAIAYLRFDRVGDGMMAGDAKVKSAT